MKLFNLLFIFAILCSSITLSADCDCLELSFIERKVDLLHSELEKARTDKLSEEIIRKNINYLEQMLLRSFNKSERKLAKYKNRLKGESEINTEADQYTFKSSTPKKVKSLKKESNLLKKFYLAYRS